MVINAKREFLVGIIFILILFVKTGGVRGWGGVCLMEKSIKRDGSYLSIVPNFGTENEIDSLS